MQLVDLSREIHHRMPRLANHPSIIVTSFSTHEESYDLEYGSNVLAIHIDAVKPGSRVVLVDDLLATGGTAGAAASLIQKIGGQLLEVTFLIELTFLSGREKLKNMPVRSIVRY